MHAIRAFLRTRRRVAAVLLVLALAMKLLVPAGYMLGAKVHVLTVEVCADSSGERQFQKIAVPDNAQADHADAGGACAWSTAAMPALSGVAPPLLALALAVILLLGFAPARRVHPPRADRFQPPLRGPPAFA